MRASGHPSGTLYPVLTRMARPAWIEAEWEELDALA
jgi:DNA-binding PadR family transcriptional regulator